MEIYIEDFIIQNTLINFCLLKLVELTTKTKTSVLKLIISSLLGAAFSVFCATFITNNRVLNMLKFVCAILMIIICFKQSLKQFIFNFLLLFIYTFAIGGAITSLSSTSYKTNFGVIISSKINLYTVCIFVIILSYIFQFVCKHLRFKIKSNGLIFKIKLYKDNNSISVNAYLDTGNFLNINGKPVIIVDILSYLKLTKTSLLDFYIAKSEKINTSTVTGNRCLKVFLLDKVEILSNNRKQVLTNQYIAINTESSFKHLNYQALLSPMLF